MTGHGTSPPAKPAGASVLSLPAILGQFAWNVLVRFQKDRGQSRAAGLAFTSLLALVPLLAVSFALFAVFPAFQELRDQAQDALFDNFVPHLGDTVRTQLREFTDRAGALTAVGVLFLFVTAVMLLSSISEVFNDIWRVHETRKTATRLTAFFAVIMLTPLLFGASLSLSSYLFAIASAVGGERVTGFATDAARLIPAFLQVLGFTLLYQLVPNHNGRWRDALTGGLVAGLLFELLKLGFGYYITAFPTYQTIYGALATIPIFLVWIYMAWIVVILGAQVSASLPEWRAGLRAAKTVEVLPLDRMCAALAALTVLLRASQQGETVAPRALLRRAGAHPLVHEAALQRLHDHRYVARSETGDWLLSRDLSITKLDDLAVAMGFGLEDRVAGAGFAWDAGLQAMFAALEAERRSVMSQPLHGFLAAAAATQVEPSRTEDGKTRGGLMGRILVAFGLLGTSQS